MYFLKIRVTDFAVTVLPLYLQPDNHSASEISCLLFDIQGGAVAQSVEQRTENPCVAGSIPAHTTQKIKAL